MVDVVTSFMFISLKVMLIVIFLFFLLPFITIIQSYARDDRRITLNGEEDYLWRPRPSNNYNIKYIASKYIHELREIIKSIKEE